MKPVKNTKPAEAAVAAVAPAPAVKTKAAVVKPAAKAAPKLAVVKPEAKPAAVATESGVIGRIELAGSVRDKVAHDGLAVSEKVALSLIKGFEACVAEAVAAGREINLPGFGKFLVRHRPARTGRNPQTGEAAPIGASYSPAFKPGSTLKQAANQRTAA